MFIFGVFLVLIFSHSDWIRRDTYLSVFSLNAGKYRPLFTRCEIHIYFIDFKYSLQLDAEYWYRRPNSPKLWRNCGFPQNSHTRKLGEITVFYVLSLSYFSLEHRIKIAVLYPCCMWSSSWLFLWIHHQIINQ